MYNAVDRADALPQASLTFSAMHRNLLSAHLMTVAQASCLWITPAQNRCRRGSRI